MYQLEEWIQCGKNGSICWHLVTWKKPIFWFPIFQRILKCMDLRNEFNVGKIYESKKHPTKLWLCSYPSEISVSYKIISIFISMTDVLSANWTKITMSHLMQLYCSKNVYFDQHSHQPMSFAFLSYLQRTFLVQYIDKPDAFSDYCREYCDNFSSIFQLVMLFPQHISFCHFKQNSEHTRWFHHLLW